MSLRVLPDELVLGQMRDWNEELQIAREFVTDTPSAKVFRDRALFKVQRCWVWPVNLGPWLGQTGGGGGFLILAGRLRSLLLN